MRVRLLVELGGVERVLKRDEVFADWSGRIRELASCPNVHVKLGGLGMKMFGFDVHEGEIAPGSEQLAGLWRPYVETCIDAFGTQRAFWGTDVTRMPCSYRQCVTMYTEEMPWLKGDDLELVMGKAICDWLGWKPA